MEIYISAQLGLFCSSIMLGLCIGLVYDLLRALRLRCPPLGPALDLLYCALCAGVIFLFVLRLSGGELRLYILLGGGGGCVLFFALFSQFLRPVWALWMDVTVRLLAVLWYPLAQFQKFLMKLLKKTKNLFLFCKKWSRILNYKWTVIRIHRRREAIGVKKGNPVKKARPRANFFTKILILVLLLGLGYQLYDLQQQVTDARVQESQLATQVSDLQQENDALTQDIENGDDPELLEKIAREKLGLVNPGEKVFYDVVS